MNDYFDSFDCQVQSEEMHWVDPCILTDEERAAEEVSDEELKELIDSLPDD